LATFETRSSTKKRDKLQEQETTPNRTHQAGEEGKKKMHTHRTEKKKPLKPAREGEAPSLAISLIFANLVNSMVKKTHTFVAQFANLLVYMVQVRVFSCVT